MNFRLASSLLLLATAATSTTAETTKSKASRYRIFPVRHRPKAGKATVGSTPVSTAVAKTSKALLPPLSVSMSVPSKAAKSKFAKAVKSKAVKCWKDDEQSVSMSMSMPTRALNVVMGRFLDHSVSMSLSVSSKAAKVSKCLPEMSLSMSIPTMTHTTPFPSYYPTIAPTLAPVRRQRMECRSGDFVDALGRDCFWYEEPNVKYGCESLLQAGSPDQDLANAEGKTPWDEVSASYTLHLFSFHCSTRTNTSTIIIFLFVTVLLLRRRGNGSGRSGYSGCFRFLHCHRS